jgi:7-carboxy-7-deazaguanine synthase
MRVEGDQWKGGVGPEPSGSQPLRIAELYASRQGEGRWTGAPSVFLRTSGCNLRCWFCDTPFTSWHPEGLTLAVDEVVQRVLAYDEPDVVITGGEPLLHAAIGQVCRQLSDAGRRITIETAGTVDQDFVCDLLSISPKLPSSAPNIKQHPAWHRWHQERREQIAIVQRWLTLFPYQLKFVISDPADTLEVLRYLERLKLHSPEHVWLMPEGTSVEILESRAEWLRPWCAQHGFQYCARQHIYWYGNQRGT